MPHATSQVGSCPRRLAVMTSRALASLAIAMLLLVGCGPGYTVEETYPKPAELTVTGTLTGVRSQAEECVWIVDASGTKFDLVLPTGWSVAYAPVRLTDPAGVLFARDGDTIRVSGPTVFGETMCASGPPFIVEQIEKL
jgi:hypothetical protein